MQGSTPLQPFESADAKAAFLREEHFLTIPDGLPCTTGWDAGPEAQCLNMATVARFEWDARQGIWIVQAICKTCTAKLHAAYERGQG